MKTANEGIKKLELLRNKHALDVQEHMNLLDGETKAVCEMVCDYMNIELTDMFLPSRKREITDARAIVATALKHKKGYSFAKIGQIVSVFPIDHTTVIHCMRKYEETLSKIDVCRVAFSNAKNMLAYPMNIEKRYNFVPTITGLHLRKSTLSIAV